jgi:hypothetical protein
MERMTDGIHPPVHPPVHQGAAQVPLVTQLPMVFQVQAVAQVPAVEALVVAGVPVVAQAAPDHLRETLFNAFVRSPALSDQAVRANRSSVPCSDGMAGTLGTCRSSKYGSVAPPRC